MAQGSGSTRLETVAFWTLLAVTLALFALFAGIVVGAVPLNDGGSASEPRVAATTEPEPAATATRTETEPEASPAPTSPPVVLVRAVRGDCWLEAREGSATGRVLFAGLLARGTAKRIPVHRAWLRLGAGQNVVVTAGGRRAPVPPGTSDVVVSA